MAKSGRSKRLHKNAQVRRNLPGFKKWLQNRDAETRAALEAATGTGAASSASVRDTLPDELLSVADAATAAARADDDVATVATTRTARVIVHNADRATTAMLTDTLNDVPASRIAKADKRKLIRESKQRKAPIKAKPKGL